MVGGWCVVTLCLAMTTAEALPPRPTLKPGARYSITLDREMEEASSDGSSSGSSTDVDTIVEHVLKVDDAGAEIAVDLPGNTDASTRAAWWQLPARVLQPDRGPPQLLNATELEARVDPWLKKGGWSRAQCGKPIFTWNYFIINCDPQSVVHMMEQFDPAPIDLRDGAIYRSSEGGIGGVLHRQQQVDGSAVLAAEMPIDPVVVRQKRGEAMVAVAKLSGESLDSEAALRKLGNDDLSGTIKVKFEIDPRGDLKRRTIVIREVTRDTNGVTKTRTTTETLERRCMAGCS